MILRRLLAGILALSLAAPALAAPASSYPAASALDGTEKVIGTQGTATVNITPEQIKDYAETAITSLPNLTSAPSLATTTSPSISLLSYVPTSEWDAIRNCTSTYDIRDAYREAENAITVDPSSISGGTYTLGPAGGRIEFPSGCVYSDGPLSVRKNVAIVGQTNGIPGHAAYGSQIWFPPNTLGLVIEYSNSFEGELGTVTSASWSAGKVTFTSSAPLNIAVGDYFFVTGMTPSGYNNANFNAPYVAVAGTSGSTVVAAKASDPGTATVMGVVKRPGSGATVSNILLNATGSNTPDRVSHGVYCLAKCELINVGVRNFAGDGYHISDEGFGNVNGFHVYGGVIYNVGGYGVFIHGGNANAGMLIGTEVLLSGGAGFVDDSFFGNAHYAEEVDATNASNLSVVTQGGTQYQCLQALTTACSTTTPGTDSSTWYPVSGFSSPPAWVNGNSYLAGGCYNATGASATAVFYNSYCEGSSSYIHVTGKNQMIAPFSGSPFTSTSNYQFTSSGTPRGYVNSQGVGSYNLAPSGSTIGTFAYSLLGGNVPTSTDAQLWEAQQQSDGNPWRLAFTGKDMELYYSSIGNAAHYLTGPNTTRQFGRSSIVPYTYMFPQIVLSSTFNAGRVWTAGSAAWASGNHAAGEVVFNQALSSVTSPFSWVTTSGGTPGTSVADYIFARADPSTGIGYVTGAGGTITQGTNRTTGVTLNKVTGAITLVSAAGSATPFTFTVTNSTVATTDTVSVSVKSGSTDTYRCVTTAVAAGSFNITCDDLTGTTTEQPVINFNVIKGATS